MKKGYVQIYTGDGKGKTTAAFGLVLRASGHGKKSYIGQFMKGQIYGEVLELKNNPNILIEQYGDEECVTYGDITKKHIELAREGLMKAEKKMLSGEFDVIVLDEINISIFFGLLTVEDVLNFLKKSPGNIEIILTGRNAPSELIDTADLVTEMKELKHYYHNGILARDGIER